MLQLRPRRGRHWHGKMLCDSTWRRRAAAHERDRGASRSNIASPASAVPNRARHRIRGCRAKNLVFIAVVPRLSRRSITMPSRRHPGGVTAPVNSCSQRSTRSRTAGGSEATDTCSQPVVMSTVETMRARNASAPSCSNHTRRRSTPVRSPRAPGAVTLSRMPSCRHRGITSSPRTGRPADASAVTARGRAACAEGSETARTRAVPRCGFLPRDAPG